MYREDHLHYDPVEIENRARQMRADAAAASARAFAGWVRRRFARNHGSIGHGGHRAA